MIHKLQVAVDERYLSLYLTVMNCDNVLCVDFCLFSVIKVCKCDIICPEPETTICTHYQDCSIVSASTAARGLESVFLLQPGTHSGPTPVRWAAEAWLQGTRLARQMYFYCYYIA